MRKAALFDLDGVIVDTEPSYTDFWKMIGDEFLPKNINFAREIKGHTLAYIFNHYFFNDQKLQSIIKQRLDEHQRTMSYPLIPGAFDFIYALRSKGIGVAVVTSSDCQKMASLYLEHCDFVSCFDRIFTAEDALRSKPSPDCYISAAGYFGLSASDCVVFEDSFNGLRAGRDSGAYVVGLSTSNPAAEIVPYCDMVVADFVSSESELLSLFE